MVNYVCPRCGYFTNIRTIYVRHLSRKHICKPVVKDVELLDQYTLYNIYHGFSMPSQSLPITPKIDILPSQSLPITPNSKIRQKMNKIANDNSKLTCYECSACKKTFTRMDNLTRHVNKSCKTLIKANDYDAKIQYLEEKITKLETKANTSAITDNSNNSSTTNNVNTTTNNVNTTNIENQINIQINGLGEENLDYITPEYIYMLAKGPNQAIPKLLKNIHFNPNHPENWNVELKNKKLPYVKVYDDKQQKWLLKDKKDTITTLVEHGYNIIDDNLPETENNSEMKNYVKFSERYDNDDKELLRRLNKNVELLLMNKS